LTLKFTNFDFLLAYKFSVFATAKWFNLRCWVEPRSIFMHSMLRN